MLQAYKDFKLEILASGDFYEASRTVLQYPEHFKDIIGWNTYSSGTQQYGILSKFWAMACNDEDTRDLSPYSTVGLIKSEGI